jgi:hypothetical protein
MSRLVLCQTLADGSLSEIWALSSLAGILQVSPMSSRRLLTIAPSLPIIAGGSYILPSQNTRLDATTWLAHDSIRARVTADQPFEFSIEQSTDTNDWGSAPEDRVMGAAGEVRTLEVKLLARYWRLVLKNTSLVASLTTAKILCNTVG